MSTINYAPGLPRFSAVLIVFVMLSFPSQLLGGQPHAMNLLDGSRVETSQDAGADTSPQTSSDEQGAAPSSQDPRELAWSYLRKSLAATATIHESLMNERGLLYGVQERFASQIIVIYKPSGEDAAHWPTQLLYALNCELRGEHQESISALHEALMLAEALPSEASFLRSRALMEISERLARQGDFEGAIEAALAIGTDDVHAAHVTEAGAFQLPQAASQSYSLLLVTKLQADAGDFNSASKTIELIKDKSAKSAAYWLLALRQAEQGNLDEAIPTTETAVVVAGPHYSWSEPNMVAEFTTKGPKLVPLDAFRLMTLGEIALQSALRGNDRRAADYLFHIDDGPLRKAVVVEMVATMSNRSEFELAEEWSDRIQGDYQSLAQYHLALNLVRAGKFEEAQRISNDIRSEAWLSRFQLDSCEFLLEGEHREQLQQTLESVQRVIDSLSPPVFRAQAQLKVATLLSEVGDDKAALANLRSAMDLLRQECEEDLDCIQGMTEIAAAMPAVGASEEAEKAFEDAVTIARQLEPFEASLGILRVIEKRLENDPPDESITQLAQSISDASARSQAINAVAVAYARQKQLTESRELLREAVDAAMGVEDFMGLDTPYCKGGAIRLIARQQAQSDLEGLLQYLETSDNPSAVAYGYLGAAEAQVPEEAARAEDRGYLYPDGIMQALWVQRPISKILAPD